MLKDLEKLERHIVNLLMSCYYDGKTVAEAVAFIERCYCDKVTDKALEKAKAIILDIAGRKWK